ncbi:MAG: hypothetical protein JJ863_36880 [Deltaproteobacteria bacterium]|nr:hypothetical protein [Deltaproteobacteria bacterium]
MNRPKLHTVRSTALRLGLLSALLLFGASCSVDPYCLTCDENDGGEPMDDAAPSDGSTRDAQPRDFGVDLGDGGCLLEELCNDSDDDCDGALDEGFDLDRDPRNCGACGNVCTPPHAFPTCTDGVCGFDTCDVGFIDINGDPSDGCEYRCTQTADDDSVCDLRDNDCDGTVDEDVDKDNDSMNCGACGRVCRFPRGSGACSTGVCALDTCDMDFHDIDGNEANGCEYRCTPADPAVEICNARDDDCDGTIDEGDPGGGETCGMDEGACTTGTTACMGGSVECVGATEPSTELCNGIDDDCDGTIDQGNPEAGRLCGSSTGACTQGREVCTAGALVCTGAFEGGPETCNTADDDCDGMVDEGNPGGGASCGSDTGACAFGMITCVSGGLTCTGGTTATGELCNGVDDDCDGMTDENNPEGGAACGSDTGVCRRGSQTCMGGTLVCEGRIDGSAEVCDGFDNDCDGNTDEGNPGGGAACGNTTGACTAGALACRSGTIVCEGGTGPGAESCNMTDDDCDGMTDEGFDLTTDPRHCGMCGNVCAATNATSICAASTCQIASCDAGTYDIDGLYSNGCEYGCNFRGAEGCNGEDDDCDGLVDEDVVIPTNFCNPFGVCAGTSAVCDGTNGFVCNYPSTFEDSETRCDGVDNDCDNSVDEAFPLAGTACSVGAGACRGTGVYVCNGTNDGVDCNATLAAMPQDEECNDADDDCDGVVDETGVDDPGTSWRDAITDDAFATVTVDLGGGNTMEMMQYEASRPDASSSAQGDANTLACSAPGVRPWTNVTWDEAVDACCAMNPSGTCTGGADEWQLCEAPDWQTACEGEGTSCDWAYTSMCTTSQPTACNGKEVDSNGGLPGDQDAIANTGAFPMCGATWTGGPIYDLSGNVREWTATSAGTNIYEQRGGAYTTIEAGRACDFDFFVANRDFAFPNTGFRCCKR